MITFIVLYAIGMLIAFGIGIQKGVQDEESVSVNIFGSLLACLLSWIVVGSYISRITIILSHINNNIKDGNNN